MAINETVLEHIFAALGKLADAQKGGSAPEEPPAPKKKRAPKFDASCCVRTAGKKRTVAPSALPGGPSFAGPKEK